MAKINLLPWREAQRKQQLQEFAVVMAIVIAVAMAIAFAWKIARESAVDSQRGRNSYVEQRISEMDEDIKEIQELQKRRDALIERMNVIQGLQGNRPTIVHVFEQFVSTLQDGIYYTSIKQVGPDFDITGYAESNNRIANMMRALDASPWFQNPQLKKVVASGEGFTFTLSLGLEQTEVVGAGDGGPGDSGSDDGAKKPSKRGKK